MLQPPGSRSTNNNNNRATSSARRKTQTTNTQSTPDQRLRTLAKKNRKCCDCSAKLPNSVNLQIGCFLCMTCAGVHRELPSSKVKGLYTSTFTEEEADGLEQRGNAVVNQLYLAHYSPSRERLQPPMDNTDIQKCRAWILKKYRDRAWYGGDGNNHAAASGSAPHNRTTTTGRGLAGSLREPTVAAIPPRPNQTAAPAVDLFGGFDAPPAAPQQQQQQQAWDAFGGSPQPAPQADDFPADFGSSQTKHEFAANFQQQQQPQQPVPPSQQQQQQQQLANFQQQQQQVPPQQQQQQQFANFQQQQQQVPPQQQQQQQFANFQQQQQQQQAPPQQQQQQAPPYQPQQQQQFANFDQAPPPTIGQFPNQPAGGQAPVPNQQQQQPGPFPTYLAAPHPQQQSFGQFPPNQPQPTQQQQFPHAQQQSNNAGGGPMHPSPRSAPSQQGPPHQQQQQQSFGQFPNQQGPPNQQQQQSFSQFPNQPQNTNTLGGHVAAPTQSQQQPSSGGESQPFGQFPNPPPPQQQLGQFPSQSVPARVQMQQPSLGPSAMPQSPQQGQQPFGQFSIQQQQQQQQGNFPPPPATTPSTNASSNLSSSALQNDGAPGTAPSQQQGGAASTLSSNRFDAFNALDRPAEQQSQPLETESTASSAANVGSLPNASASSAAPGTKTTASKKGLSKFKAGMRAFYKSSSYSGPAEILKVHLDDDLEPFYTIKVQGKEKQTDNGHLDEISPLQEEVEAMLFGLSENHLKNVQQFVKQLSMGAATPSVASASSEPSQHGSASSLNTKTPTPPQVGLSAQPNKGPTSFAPMPQPSQPAAAPTQPPQVQAPVTPQPQLGTTSGTVGGMMNHGSNGFGGIPSPTSDDKTMGTAAPSIMAPPLSQGPPNVAPQPVVQQQTISGPVSGQTPHQMMGIPQQATQFPQQQQMVPNPSHMMTNAQQLPQPPTNGQPPASVQPPSAPMSPQGNPFDVY